MFIHSTDNNLEFILVSDKGSRKWTHKHIFWCWSYSGCRHPNTHTRTQTLTYKHRRSLIKQFSWVNKHFFIIGCCTIFDASGMIFTNCIVWVGFEELEVCLKWSWRRLHDFLHILYVICTLTGNAGFWDWQIRSGQYSWSGCGAGLALPVVGVGQTNPRSPLSADWRKYPCIYGRRRRYALNVDEMHSREVGKVQ